MDLESQAGRSARTGVAGELGTLPQAGATAHSEGDVALFGPIRIADRARIPQSFIQSRSFAFVHEPNGDAAHLQHSPRQQLAPSHEAGSGPSTPRRQPRRLR